MMRRYLANLHSPLSKFRSLGLTFIVYKTFPPRKHVAFPLTLHFTDEETEWQSKGMALSTYYPMTDLDGAKSDS